VQFVIHTKVKAVAQMINKISRLSSKPDLLGPLSAIKYMIASKNQLAYHS